MGTCLKNPCPAGQSQIPEMVVTPSGTSWALTCETTGAGTGIATPTPKLCPDGKPASATGECVVAQPADPATTPNLCPAGFVNMSADPANPLCVAAPKKDTSVETVKNADGSTSTTTTYKFTQTNPDGTTSTSQRSDTTTTSADGTTTTTSSTSKNGTDQTNQDPSDICKTNPNLTICQKSSVSGDCAQTTCEGDAITCAILQKQRQEYCEATTDTPASILGAQLIAGNDPAGNSLPNPSNGLTQDFSGNSVDTTGWLGGGAGLSDVHLTVRGQAINIPLSNLNQYLLALRAAIMVLALLASFRMVSGVIFRE